MTKCAICRLGEIQAGQTTVTLEQGKTLMVFRSVPARVCASCGEEYVCEEITAQLLRQAEEAVRAGVQVAVREYPWALV